MPSHDYFFFALFLRPLDCFRDLRGGTLAPFSRASLKPIAIACLRLFTGRPDPLLSVPRFRRCIADFTVLRAAFPYFAMCTSRLAHCEGRAESTAVQN